MFVPLQKVELVAYIEEEGEEEAEDSGNFTDEEEDSENMRIVVKSLKSPTKVPTLKTDGNNIIPNGEDLSGSNDSGIMSPTRVRERMPNPRTEKKSSLKRPTQRLVVSSFVAPSPTKVVVKKNEIKEKILNGEHILGPKSTIITTKNEKVSVNTPTLNNVVLTSPDVKTTLLGVGGSTGMAQNDIPILNDHTDSSAKPELLKQNGIKDNNTKTNTEKEKSYTVKNNNKIREEEGSISKTHIVSQVHTKPVPPRTISEDNVFLDEPNMTNLPNKTSPETPEGSKIPRRVSAATIQVGQQKKETEPPPAPTILPRRVKKTSTSDTTTKTTHLPIKLRSVATKTRTNSIDEGDEKSSEQKTKVAVPRVKKISTTNVRTKKPSVEERKTKISIGGKLKLFEKCDDP